MRMRNALRPFATLLIIAIAALLAMVFVSVILGGASGCANRIVIQDPPAVPAGDAGDDCARACNKLSLNKCPVGDNDRCPVVCRIDQAQGVGVNLDPSCILNATTRSAIAACGVSCP